VNELLGVVNCFSHSSGPANGIQIKFVKFFSVEIYQRRAPLTLKYLGAATMATVAHFGLL
jgi:hypothetical protein